MAVMGYLPKYKKGLGLAFSAQISNKMYCQVLI